MSKETLQNVFSIECVLYVSLGPEACTKCQKRPNIQQKET